MSLPSSRYSVPALVGLAAMVSLSFPTPALAADAGSGARPPAIMRVASENLSATPPAGRPAVASAYPAVKPLAPRTATARPSHEVFGFAQAGGLGGGTGVGWNTWDYSLLTTVAYFGVHVAGDGTIITGDTGYSTWRGADVTSMINAAHGAGARAVLTLVCQDYPGSACGSGGYCAALQNQATTITQAVNEMTSRGVDGINVDYEGSSQTCPNGQSTRTLLRSLVQGLRARAPGMHLTVDTYASSAGDSAGPIDVPGMAAAVNGFFVMAYELDNSNWGAAPLSCSRYCFSPTSPLSGYSWTDDRVAREYSAAAGAGKTILGLPYYGYAACVQSLTENAYPYPTGGTPPPRWSVPTEVSAQGLAGSVSGYSAHRDSHNGADFWATYYSPDYGCNRELYLDDAYSLGRKYDLVLAYGLGGAGMWSLDYGGGIGSLWDAIATHFTTRPAAPTGVTACGAASSAYVSWTPGSGGGAVASYTVTAAPGGATVTAPANQTGVTFPGLSAGTSYSFTVTATNGSGPSAFSAASGAVTPAASAKTAYFTWFDRASPGMLNDNIHLVNPGPGDDGGCVYVSGVAVQPFGLAAGGTTYVAFPGQIGGPVLVTTTSGSALAAQRVQYNGSFNEVPAAASPQSSLWFPWYDHASSGMVADNIHVVNPGSAPATVRITGPGTPGSITVQPGAEGIFSWPQGVLGGPVSLTTDPATPVIASQRVQYYGTFNETLARGSQDAGQDLVFNWYDHASPGMWNDNVHLVNPQTNDITVSLSVAGASAKVSVPALGGTFVNLGNVIGGPLWVHSDGGKVIASQRVQYYGSFNEAGGTPTSAAAASIWMPWYDAASPGMFIDNVHVLNPNGTPVTALVQAPGGAKTVQLQPYGEGYVNWPGTIGGPVHVTSTGGNVIASQRVQYYQTFNEAGGLVA